MRYARVQITTQALKLVRKSNEIEANIFYGGDTFSIIYGQCSINDCILKLCELFPCWSEYLAIRRREKVSSRTHFHIYYCFHPFYVIFNIYLFFNDIFNNRTIIVFKFNRLSFRAIKIIFPLHDCRSNEKCSKMSIGQ